MNTYFSAFIGINRDVAKENFDLKTSFNFDNSPRLPFRYAEAFIYVILPYGSFHQINYVRPSNFNLCSITNKLRLSQKFASHERYSLERHSQELL